MRTIYLLCAVLQVWSGLGMAATADRVSQYEFTWYFDHAYTVGQFANGDWWVIGPVTITNITPTYRVRDFYDFTTARTKGVVLKKINGWQVNPTFQQKQGFDETLLEFDSTVVPALPYLAQSGQYRHSKLYAPGQPDDRRLRPADRGGTDCGGCRPA